MIIMLPIKSNCFPRTHTHTHHDPLILTRYDKNVVKHAMAARPTPEKVKVEELPPWVGEPERIEDLIKVYNVEAKVPGRTPGTTLFLVSATKRDGTIDAGQKLQSGGSPGFGSRDGFGTSGLYWTFFYTVLSSSNTGQPRTKQCPTRNGSCFSCLGLFRTCMMLVLKFMLQTAIPS